jgi:uncharacterized membrane-anchored protein
MFSSIPHLSQRARLSVLVVMTLLILTIVNVEIAGKERIIRDGTTVLLRIAPRDPRSLIQGDYMALRYSMARRVANAANAADLSDGHAIIELSDDGEATFVTLDLGQQLDTGQLLLRFRKRGDSVRLASDAFFFEEGQLEKYSAARYGELSVDQDGNAVLTGLRDSNGERLGAPLH